ncbi:DUF4040 family protein [Ornithinimicrobium sediminis]|uniref:DUF4040 family protein n=1 Tax=Ornithinimicrobium sediminis TaxID=2904603 RepID=UPI001E4D77E4|nr:DUF4040 family protein [Ornithinimicrobium sediminis]MCE0485889.1 DUF4040 family protein [Ornithinimicrobium sediminis]
MALLWTLLVVAVAVAVAPACTRYLGRDAGYPLGVIYLVATAVFLPAAAAVLRGEPVTYSAAWVPDLGVNFALQADGIGVVFTMIALVIGAVVFFYSARYLHDGRHLSFYLVMAAFTLSMVGLVLADDLILLFMAWELTSLASFLLIARSGYGGELASLRTMIITFVGGLTMLAAAVAMIARTGTTSVTEVLAHPVWDEDPTFTTVMAVLVLLAAFTKSAQFPFHVWLPDAMAAATPVSAYLHAAAVVKAGIFLLMRFTPAFHETPVWNYTLIFTGLFTCAMAGWFALQKTDLKKLMAYSTVSQLGLIVATIGVGTGYALAAATLHVIAHALFKSGLFMMVGVIDHAAHTRDMRRLPALRKQMPWSFATVVIGCASMAGIPPLLGFVSKESVFTAMREAPGPEWVGWVALFGAVGASVLTFSYCAKIVFGAFVDGDRDDLVVHEAQPSLLLPAALPILVGVPLALVAGVFDNPVGYAVQAALPDSDHEPHFVLWHGLVLELWLSLAIIAIGVVLIMNRARLRPWAEHDTLNVDGAWVMTRMVRAFSTLGRVLVRTVRADHPTRHVAPQFVMLSLVALAGLPAVMATVGLAPLTPDLGRPIDLMMLVVIVGGVVGMVTADSRLAATVSLSAVGVAVTVQIFSLGAPDVGLTQLLVEALTILMIMLVLQKLPLRFGRAPRYGQSAAAGLAIVTGVAAGLLTWGLTGRRERTPVAQYYLNEGPAETGGDNIVNTILVEFRALDTLGELAVLGMAGVAIIAVLSTIRDADVDPPPEDDRSYVPAPEVPLREPGSTAYRAITESWSNAVPLQLLVRTVTPLLALISAILFLRGHNAPGGGFIAALVGSAIVALVYLSAAKDHAVGPPRLPVYLIAGGVLTAIGAGLYGLAFLGSFLEPQSGYILGYGVGTALIFDVGVYLAVLGLVICAFNLLGAAQDSKEHTRERADQQVEGELPGPMDTVRGERPGRRTTFLASDTPPLRGGGRR